VTTCERCGAEVALAGEHRTRIHAHDLTESSGAWYHGRLCVACWRELTAFLAGEPAEPAPDRRREVTR
jgi:hypothetical protein